MTDRLAYSVKEAALALGVSEWKVREAIYQKQLFAVNLGRRLVIPRWALDRLLSEPDSLPDENAENSGMAEACDWQRETPSAVSPERTSCSGVIVRPTTNCRSRETEWPGRAGLPGRRPRNGYFNRRRTRGSCSHHAPRENGIHKVTAVVLTGRRLKLVVWKHYDGKHPETGTR